MIYYLPHYVLRHMLNIWPPFFFSGIRIISLSKDFRSCALKLRYSRLTQNINGAQYGGSLFAMTDPVYSIMLIPLLGKKYLVWDRAAEIEFKKPGKGPIYLSCNISEELLENIYKHTSKGDKYLPTVVDNLYNEAGEVIATVTRTLYVRLKSAYRPTCSPPSSGVKQ
ncbi:MAG: DUF4442 domain-containing protein [Neisseriaceae bacterium]